jgi:hypothetical protein
MTVASDAGFPASEFESPWSEQNNLSCASEADHRFFRTNSGSFAILAAIRRASSRVMRLAADRRPGSSS